MRSPVGPGFRSQSPKERPLKPDMVDHAYPVNKGPIQELDNLWKQTQATLKHFRDVVAKNKLEMLPGNGRNFFYHYFVVLLWFSFRILLFTLTLLCYL